MKDLLKRLVGADSTLGKGEATVAEIVAAEFKKHGIDRQIDRWGPGRANVVARVRSAGKRPGLLFVCHLDVVGPGDEPWEHPPFSATEENGRIYGRGTTDMKGGIASVVAAICETVDSRATLQGDILFAATAGEETDSSGVQRFMQEVTWLPPLAGIILPEPTDLTVVTAHRGLFWLKITTRGKAVHSSMSERGINAILSMKRVLDELEHFQIPTEPHPLLGKCSLSVNTITGGEAMNMVPDRCTLGVDIRTLPGQDETALGYDLERLLTRLKATVPHFGAELTVERIAHALETDPQCAFVKALCSVAEVDLTNGIAFTTDAPHLVPLGVPIVIYGPGNPKLCHQVDEYIAVADLHKSVARFKKIIRAFLT